MRKFQRLCDFAQVLELEIPSDRQMRKTIREIGSIATERVFDGWQEISRELAVNVAGVIEKNVKPLIRGQYRTKASKYQSTASMIPLAIHRPTGK